LENGFVLSTVPDKRWLPTRSPTAGWLGCLLASVILCGYSVAAGAVEYPALGNLDLQEGTLEIWLTPTVDLYPKLAENQYQGVMSLFSLSVPDHFSMGASWYGRGDRHRLHISMGAADRPGALIPVPAGPADWETGNRHHLAFTWRGPEMRLYADGKLVGQRDQATTFSGDLWGCNLMIGGGKFAKTGFVLHAVRISNVAAAADALCDAQPTTTVHTLLLDRFDDVLCVDDDHRTEAVQISGMTGEAGGTVTGACHMTDTPVCGLALFPAPKPEQQ